MGNASKKNLVSDEILNFELEMKCLADYSVLLFVENKLSVGMGVLLSCAEFINID